MLCSSSTWRRRPAPGPACSRGWPPPSPAASTGGAIRAGTRPPRSKGRDSPGSPCAPCGPPACSGVSRRSSRARRSGDRARRKSLGTRARDERTLYAARDPRGSLGARVRDRPDRSRRVRRGMCPIRLSEHHSAARGRAGRDPAPR